MHRRRNFGLMALGGALLAALAWGFWPRPVLVEVSTTVRGPLQVTIEEEGQTRVKDRFVISAPVAGYLRRIELDVGDTLTQGQTVAVLEPLRPEVLDPRSRARAEAQIAAAQAALEAAAKRSPRRVPRRSSRGTSICANRNCVPKRPSPRPC
jgi:HlyD family secretion protein